MDERTLEQMEERHEQIKQAEINRILRKFDGESASECEECGDGIPEARRAAIKGVKMCFECASENEIRGRR